MTQGTPNPATVAASAQRSNSALPTTFDAFDLQSAMVYDTNDRNRAAAELAKQQIQQLSPLAGRLGNEVTELVKNGALTHDDKIARLTAMRSIATGQPLAKLYGMNNQNALEVLQASPDIPESTKLGLERAFLPEDDARHIGFDNQGTPEEVGRLHNEVTTLKEANEAWMKFVNETLRPILDDYSHVLDLDMVDDEKPGELAKRITEARENGSVPVNLEPLASTTGGTTPPAPTHRSGSGTPPQPKFGARLKNAFAPNSTPTSN